MVEIQEEKKHGINSLALTLISVIIGVAIFCAVLSFVYPDLSICWLEIPILPAA